MIYCHVTNSRQECITVETMYHPLQTFATVFSDQYLITTITANYLLSFDSAGF
jgi:hypothetical protein